MEKDIINRLASIPEEEPDEIDLLMIEEAERINDGTTVTLEEFNTQNPT